MLLCIAKTEKASATVANKPLNKCMQILLGNIVFTNTKCERLSLDLDHKRQKKIRLNEQDFFSNNENYLEVFDKNK